MLNLAARTDKIICWLTIVILPVIPLFFLPLTVDFYDTNKWILLVAFTLVILVLWALRTVASHTLAISVSHPALGFGALFVASLVSVIFASPNKMEALTVPYGPTLYIAVCVIFLISHFTLAAHSKIWLRRLWYAVLVIMSLVAIYQFFGVGKTMFPTITFLANELWTPVGSTLSLIALLSISLPLVIEDLGMSVKKKEDASMAVLFSLLLIVIAGLVVSFGKLIPVANQSVLSVLDGWAITLETLKDPKRLLLGVGIENFLYAFTTGRPPLLNAGPLWNLRFTSNASLLFHIMTTMGAVGLVAALILIKSLLPGFNFSGRNIARLFAVASIFLVPPTITLYACYSVLLLLTQPDHGKQLTVVLPATMRWISGTIAVVMALVVVLSGYGLARVYAAELVFFRSLQALQANDGTATYNLQIQAATIAPFISRYHLAYSQTNLAIANAMALNAQTGQDGQPVTLSDADRQTISSLIQQSIREAKIAVNLAPENVVAWENLAALYQSLINVVADIDQWAIATYQRSIQLDPTNPALRLGLGGVHLLRNDAESAVMNFAIAASLKPDWANAYYNLAYAYKLKKDNLRSAAALKQTLDFLPGNSQDRDRVTRELEETKKLLSPAELALMEGRQPTQDELQKTSELTRPDQQPRPEITPRIELPPDASPPAAARQAQAEASEGQTQGIDTEVGPEEINPTVQPQQ